MAVVAADVRSQGAQVSAFTAMTLLCGVDDQGLVIDILRKAGAEPDAVDGHTTIELSGGQMVLTAKVFEPNSEFSRVILGLHNMFRGAQVEKGTPGERALGLLEECDLIIGVRCEPPAAVGEERWHVLLAVASRMDALIFDGSRLLDADGEVILNAPTRREPGD